MLRTPSATEAERGVLTDEQAALPRSRDTLAHQVETVAVLEGDLLPTPIKSDGEHGPDYARENRPSGADDLTTAVARLDLARPRGTLLPTPAARDEKGPADPNRQGGPDLSTVAELLPTPSTSNRDGNQRNNRGDLLLPGVAEELLPTPSVAIADGGQTSRSGARKDELLLGGIAEALPLLPTPVVTDSEEARNSTAGRSNDNHAGHSGDTLLDAMTKLGVADPGSLLPTPLGSDGDHGGPNQRGGRGDLRLSSIEALFPTPVTDPDSANGHARDLATEAALFPTPSASQNGDDADPVAFAERKAADAAKWGTGGVGTPLGVAARTLPDDGPEDVTADGDLVRWGKYRPAIVRAQQIIGRLAPSPTRADGKGGKRRLAALFVEWMMMLAPGWVTGVPGITRREALKLLGNGVVPPQAAVASVILLGRVRERLAERRARQVAP